MDKASLEKMLARGMDSSLLRFGLGKACLDAGEPSKAAEHLRACLAFDGEYSAAWKLLGKALAALQDNDGARSAWQAGLAAAQRKGDKQAEKEMQVFLRKLDK